MELATTDVGLDDDYKGTSLALNEFVPESQQPCHAGLEPRS